MPTRTRFFVAFWLCTMAGVLYLDRICWGQAAPAVQKSFDLTNRQLAYILIAFQIAYGLFEIPTGWWGDRIGARAVLTRITIWWSAFTALTGACTGLTSLLVVRFLFGAGEAGAYPNAARVLTRWFPAAERGRVQGAMLATSLLCGAAAPALAAFLIDRVGWQWSFVVFGAVGVVWAVGFWTWFRDDPAQHPGVNAAELAMIQAGGTAKPPERDEAVPWAAVVRNRGIISLSLILTCSSFNSYFYFSWFPKYLQAAHGVSNQDSGLLTTVALTGAAVGMLSGGWMADRIWRRSASPVAMRKAFGATAYLLAALSLYAAVQCESAGMLAVLAGLSCLCVQLTMPTWWSAAIEQSGKHVGALFGLMNMMGTVGALASQWFVGEFSEYQAERGLTGREQWDPMFQVYVGVLLLGTIGWGVLYRPRPLT